MRKRGPARRFAPAAVRFFLGAALLGAALPGALPAAETPRAATPIRVGGETDSQINESATDDAGIAEGVRPSPQDVPGQVREFVEGSVAKYDQVKNGAAGFRKQGWYPSFFLREPDRDVVFDRAADGTMAVSVDLSCARRDIEQRLIVGPQERFLLPGADRRFLAELLTALATASPAISRVRIVFWFAGLRADGRLVWENRGSLALQAAAARRIPRGGRTPQAVWPVLEENTVPQALWGD